MSKKVNNSLDKLSAVEIYKKIKDGSMKKFPYGFWQGPEAKKNAIEISKYLIEDFLKWTDEDIKKYVCYDTFVKNELLRAMREQFSSSPVEAINSVYPNKFKPWELRSCSIPKGYWTLETGTEATKWLIEKKLKWTDNEIKEHLCLSSFTEHGLLEMFRHIFNYSSFNAVNSVYPGKFRLWELKSSSMPKGYWTLETGIDATKWLIEEKLKLSINEIEKNISKDDFVKNGLSAMLRRCFNNSYKSAINTAYPELKLKP